MFHTISYFQYIKSLDVWKTKLDLSSFWWKTICQNKKCHFYYDSDNNKKRSDVFMDDNECSFCPVFMVQDVSSVSSSCRKTQSQLLNIIWVKMCIWEVERVKEWEREEDFFLTWTINEVIVYALLILELKIQRETSTHGSV